MPPSLATVRDLLGAQLLALGVSGVFVADGASLGDLGPLPMLAGGPPEVAALLADAAGRLGGQGRPDAAGAALLPGRTLRLSSAPGLTAEPVTIADASELPATLAAWSIGVVHTAVELVLDLDLDAPAPPGAGPLVLGRTEGQMRAVTLDPALADLGVVVLAGPGLVRGGLEAVAGLREMAAATGAGVLNTWGAKGLYRWDDPHHHGTVGLQARDFELGGLHDGRLIVVTGIDPFEAPEPLWQSGLVVEAAPDQLALLAARWPADAAGAPPPAPPLYAELRAALAPLYGADSTPLNPARAAADLNDVRPAGALVAADPGPAGLWIARALPTTELGSVVVPATTTDGFAAAAAAVASLTGRVAIGVTTHPVSERTDAVLRQAAQLGAPVVLEAWGAGADAVDPRTRRERLAGALLATRTGDGPPVQVLGVPVDFSATGVLVEVAGEVIAWGGLR